MKGSSPRRVGGRATRAGLHSVEGGLVLMETHLGLPESKGVLKGGTRGFEADEDRRSHLLLGQTQHPSGGTVTLCCCWGIKYSIDFRRMGCSVQQSHGEGTREGKEKYAKWRQSAQHFSIFPNLRCSNRCCCLSYKPLPSYSCRLPRL